MNHGPIFVATFGTYAEALTLRGPLPPPKSPRESSPPHDDRAIALVVAAPDRLIHYPLSLPPLCRRVAAAAARRHRKHLLVCSACGGLPFVAAGG
jgi:hypothetical protein